VSRQLLVTLTIVWLRLRNQRRHAQQFAAADQVFGPVPVAEKTIMANALEAVWQDMQQKFNEVLLSIGVCRLLNAGREFEPEWLGPQRAGRSARLERVFTAYIYKEERR